MFAGFHRKTVEERVELIEQSSKMTLGNMDLPQDKANCMIENFLGKMVHIPIGVIPRMLIDGNWKTIPMSIEEPSVIAAACSAVKLANQNGGFNCSVDDSVMTCQIQLINFENESAISKGIIALESYDIIEYGNKFCPNMVKRGGGVKGMEVRRVKDFIVVHINVNVGDAMGANIVNTVAEGCAPLLQRISGAGDIGLRILTNLCTKRMALAECSIPISLLAKGDMSGEIVGKRMVQAFEFADVDPFRACTHNKGIMNGIGAVALATGQDWRAIEAAGHAYASMTGHYRSLSSFRLSEDHSQLECSLSMPLSVGTCGGSIKVHPGFSTNLEMLGNPNAKELSAVIVSVGLAQNIAAIRALVSEGIQKGHMGLHNRNIAMAAGAAGKLLDDIIFILNGELCDNADIARKRKTNGAKISRLIVAAATVLGIEKYNEKEHEIILLWVDDLVSSMKASSTGVSFESGLVVVVKESDSTTRKLKEMSLSLSELKDNEEFSDDLKVVLELI